MSENEPIKLILINFSKKDDELMRNCFIRSQFWSKPWQLVESMDQAQVILLNQGENSKNYFENDPQKVVISYGNENADNNEWFLKKQRDGSFSLLEFSQLLIKVGYFVTERSHLPSEMIEQIDNTAETFPVDDGNQDIKTFLDRITSLLDRGKSKKTKFNSK